jgi:ribosomal protein S27AE
MREWRKKHPLVSKHWKGTTRAYANVCRRRGKLKPQPCEQCGEAKVQMHHDDYTKPLQVRWLCRACHLALHKNVKRETIAKTIAKTVS